MVQLEQAGCSPHKAPEVCAVVVQTDTEDLLRNTEQSALRIAQTRGARTLVPPSGVTGRSHISCAHDDVWPATDRGLTPPPHRTRWSDAASLCVAC